MKKVLDADAIRRILKRAMGKVATWQEIDQVKDHVAAQDERIAALEAEIAAYKEATK